MTNQRVMGIVTYTKGNYPCIIVITLNTIPNLCFSFNRGISICKTCRTFSVVTYPQISKSKRTHGYLHREL